MSGQSGVRDQADPSKWFALSSVALSVQGAVLAGVQAGAPRVELGTPQPRGTFWINGRICKPAAARLPLAPRSLGGGVLNRFNEYFKCTTSKRILLHVRGEFRSAVRLPSRDGVQSTEAPLSEGYLAIQTERGEPLLYADALASGMARLFHAGNCVRG